MLTSPLEVFAHDGRLYTAGSRACDAEPSQLSPIIGSLCNFVSTSTAQARGKLDALRLAIFAIFVHPAWCRLPFSLVTYRTKLAAFNDTWDILIVRRC